MPNPLHRRLSRVEARLDARALDLPIHFILTDDDALRHQAWLDALAPETRAAVLASGRVCAVDFRVHRDRAGTGPA